MSGDDAIGEADMADDAGLPAAPRFDVVLRGYDRRQVDEHVERLQRVFARMRADLDAARSDAPPALGPSPRPVPRPGPGTPEGDQIGSFTDRMQSILAEAEAEAAEIRRAAQRAARAETDGVRAQLADLIRQRDNVYAELTRMRAQLEGMLAAPTASMPARYGPDRGPVGPPGHGPLGAPPHGPAGGPPFGPAGPVPAGPVRPGAVSGPAQPRPDGLRGPDGAPPEPPGGPVAGGRPGAAPPVPGVPPGTPSRPVEQRPVPGGVHIDPDALDARAARRAADDASGQATASDADGGPDRERRGPGGTPPGPIGAGPRVNGSGGAPGAPRVAGPGGSPPGTDRPDGTDPASAADAAARREPGRPAHRLPTGAYPAVTGEPPERPGSAAPPEDDLFRAPAGRGVPPADAGPADRRPAEQPGATGPERPGPERPGPERSGSDGGRAAEPTDLAPVPGGSSARPPDSGA